MAFTEDVDHSITHRGRTLLELYQRDDGTWIVTQLDVEIEGTGETGALAAMDFCRKVAEGAD